MMTPGHDPIPGQNTHRYLIEDGAQCLKITEKVAFNIASEASYVYILSGQKFIKNAKTGQKMSKLKCDILGDFQTMCFRILFRVT